MHLLDDHKDNVFFTAKVIVKTPSIDIRFSPNISDRCSFDIFFKNSTRDASMINRTAKTGFYLFISERSPHPPPYPKVSQHIDYGLQYKITVKLISTLFFTNMVVKQSLTS